MCVNSPMDCGEGKVEGEIGGGGGREGNGGGEGRGRNGDEGREE